MKTALYGVLFSLVSTLSFAQTPDRIQGLGKDREHLTPQLVAERTEALKQASEFFLLRYPPAKDAPQRILDLMPILEDAGKTYGVDPYLIAAIGFVESYGRPDVVSPTGPVGWGQFSKVSAKEMGLKLVTQKRKVVTTRLVWKGTGKKRHQVPVKRTSYVTEVVSDDRLDPAKAIPAVAARLARSYRVFGGWDFAIQEFHNGAGRVRKMVSLYLGKPVNEDNAKLKIEAAHLTYPQLFFDNTPYHRPEVYKYLEEIRLKADFAPTYYFRVMQAYDLLKRYRESSLQYAELYDRYRSRFKPDGFATSRMWYFYTPVQVVDLEFQDLLSVQKAREVGRLVPLPEPWESFGFRPRLHGESPIAEKDPQHRDVYIQAEPATVGCLLYIMNELRLLQGKRFAPYEVNSLVRTQAYQEALKSSNSNAKTDLPTHTMGKAFDLPMKGISKQRRSDLMFILADMDSEGMLSYIPEGKQDTIHVVFHPLWETFFARVYRQNVNTRAAVPTQRIP